MKHQIRILSLTIGMSMLAVSSFAAAATPSLSAGEACLQEATQTTLDLADEAGLSARSESDLGGGIRSHYEDGEHTRTEISIREVSNPNTGMDFVCEDGAIKSVVVVR